MSESIRWKLYICSFFCPQREIKLSTDLQAVAVSVTLEKEITLCSVYIPPSFALRSEHLNSLLKQLPSPFFLLGDFNGHNVLWGSKDNDPRGKVIENFITKNDICLMNDKSHTYLDSGKGTFSSIDLSLCHPSISLDYDWSVYEDQHGSDHFPIIIESLQHSSEDHNPKWKLNKADWDLFHSLCKESLTAVSLSDSIDPHLLLPSAVNVFLRPRQVLRKATHGTIKIVKKLLKKGNKHCLSSASTQKKKI